MVVIGGFVLMAIGTACVIGFFISLSFAPKSFWSSIGDKIEKCLVIISDDKTDDNL